MTLAERLWIKVDRSGGPDACWEWQASLKPNGRPQFWDGHHCALAHRVAYKLVYGDIPFGLQLDHLCRNIKCVNPAHLEPVTARVNQARSPISKTTLNSAKTHCPRGHPHSQTNTYLTSQNKRICRACKLLRSTRLCSAKLAKLMDQLATALQC